MRTPSQRFCDEVRVYGDNVALVGQGLHHARVNTRRALPAVGRAGGRTVRRVVVLMKATASAVGWIGIGFACTLGEHQPVAGALLRFLILLTVLGLSAWRTRVAWARISPPRPKVYAKAQSAPAPAAATTVQKHTTPARSRQGGSGYRAARRASAAARRQAEAQLINESRA